MPYKINPWDTIYLIGYRCTGKTTTGRILANLLNRPFVDTDRELEKRFATTIEDMVTAKGWEYFREKEKHVLQSLDSLNGENTASAVVATGGGIILDPENRSFFRSHGFCVWLHADKATIIKRLASDSCDRASRPSLTRDNLLDETGKMLDIRTPLYKELARIKIDTAAFSPEQAALSIKRRILHGRL